MADICSTIYVISGPKEEFNDFKDKLMSTFNESESKTEITGDDLIAKYNDITGTQAVIYLSDVKKISDFYDVAIDYTPSDDSIILLVETKWLPEHSLFEDINEKYDFVFSISYLSFEYNSDYFVKHDEGGYFTNIECCANDVLTTYEKAIEEWCEMMGESRNGRSEEDMIDLIYSTNEKYEDDEDDEDNKYYSLFEVEEE